MRRLLLLFTVLALLPLSFVLSQADPDLILEERGDTLVIKDDLDYGGFNTLYTVINADTLNVPEGRVYMLKANGYYSLINAVTSSAVRKTIIMGENDESVKTREGAAPPIICGAFGEGQDAIGGINSGSDLLVKNVNISIGNSGGSIGWTYLGFGPGAHNRFQLQNSIVEHTWWVVFGSVQGDSRIHLTNNYFVNLAGHACRRNGGVIDYNGGTPTQDSLIVENNTHINTQGIVYKNRPSFTVKRQTYNHNTFINCAGSVFMNTGGHADFSVTNNIFVNCNIQPFSSSLSSADAGELDPDLLPMGLVNVHADSAFVADGGEFYVDKNLIYWDASLTDAANGVVATVNASQVNGATDWQSQMITMNSRSQSMFDDDVTYPYLTEGEWITDKLPNFAETDVLFTDQLAIVKEFAISTVDTTFTGPLTLWRQPANDPATFFTYADWPIPVDLSYDDADLLTAGLNGFPLGDLDWFPAQKATWMAQRDAEMQQIHEKLYGIVSVEKLPGLPEKFEVSQNYPNPFNPTTVINFTIPQAGNVSLKVYNSLGQEVATLVNGYMTPSNYKVDFNGSNLSSGVYYYTIKANNFTQTKKMMLVK